MNKLYDDYDKFPIRYANCWEDSMNLLRTAPERARILSICSGGDNTFALLLKNPHKITAFDTNIYQIYLAQLKIAAIQNLSYEEVLILLGIKNGDAKAEFAKLHYDLSPEVYSFFANHPEFFTHGLIHIGKFEHYFQLFRKYVCPLFASKKQLAQFATLDDLAKQQKFYAAKINNRRLHVLFKLFFGVKMMSKLGRDKNYYSHMPEDHKRNNASEIKVRFDDGVTRIINQTNPYLNYILLNRFNTNCLPTYLEPQNYQIIKQRLNRINFVHGALTDISGQYDYFNLSDIFEYMSQSDYLQNVRHLAKLATPGAKIVYYNMQNSRYIDQSDTHFAPLTQASQAGYLQNRAYFYRDFLVYQKIAKPNQKGQK